MNFFGKIIKITTTTITLSITTYKTLNLYKKSFKFTKKISQFNRRLEFKLGDFVYIQIKPKISIKIIK